MPDYPISNIVTAKIIGQEEDYIPGKHPGSQQIEDPFAGVGAIAGVKILEPEADPTLWIDMLTANTRLNSITRAIARMTVGLGYDIVQKIPDWEKGKINEELLLWEHQRVAELFANPNGEYSTTELFFRSMYDEQAIGNSFIEVVPQNKLSSSGLADVAGIRHAPGHTIRKTKDDPGFVQVRSGRYAFFKMFSDERVFSVQSGQEEVLTDPTKRANEMIHFHSYSPFDDHYGVPKYVASTNAIAGNRLQGSWNVKFIQNNAHVPYAVIVENGTLDNRSMQYIETFINKRSKGPDNSGRLLLLQGAISKGSPKADPVTIRLVPLNIGNQEDASFLRYREANDEEIREAFNFSLVNLGTTKDVNKAVAIITRRITIEQIIEPEAANKEEEIFNTIIKRLGVKYTRIRFRRPQTIDYLEASNVIEKLAKSGAFGINDIRRYASEQLGFNFDEKPGGIYNIPFKILDFLAKYLKEFGGE
jgi:PBSX family phage portal protein